MIPRLVVLGGLLAGALVAVLVGAAVLVAAPEIAQRVSPPPAPTVMRPSPSTAAPATPSSARPVAATPGPSPSPTAGSIGDPGGGSSPTPVAATLFGVGGPAKPLVVPRVGGGTIDLAALLGKAVWVNFTGTYCPPCRDEEPLMEGFAARYRDDGLVVVAVHVREDEATVAAFAKELGVTFPLGLDGDGSVGRAWGAVALPVHVWIDAQGIVRDAAIGGIGPDVMARGVGAILPGVTVTP